MEVEITRPLEKREYIYASEVGGSLLTRYMRMSAIPPTNPPNPRSRRKFTAGSTLEWIVGLVLRRAGLLVSEQKRTEDAITGMLPVHGKVDFVFGGVPRMDESLSEIEKLGFPPQMQVATEKIIEHFKKELGEKEIDRKILEVKSLSSMMMAMVQRNRKPLYHHESQAWHYSKCLKMPAEIAYIDRECLLIEEFDITPSADEFYRKDIAEMSGCFFAKQQPPLDKEVLFDSDAQRFTKNFLVEYSPYLTMFYGYKTPEEYRLAWDKRVSSWNRVFKRCVNGDKMTANNIAAISDAKDVFGNWDDLVDVAKASGVQINGEDEE